MLNRDISSGANTMPISWAERKHHRNHADVQWLIQTAFMRSILRETGQAVTSDFNVMCQAKGISGEVELTLLEMNAMERLREANIFVKEEEALIKLIDHLSKSYADGYIKTMDELIETYEQRKASDLSQDSGHNMTHIQYASIINVAASSHFESTDKREYFDGIGQARHPIPTDASSPQIACHRLR